MSFPIEIPPAVLEAVEPVVQNVVQIVEPVVQNVVQIVEPALTPLAEVTQNYLDLWLGGLKPHPSNVGKFGMSLEFALGMDLGYLVMVFVGSIVMRAFATGFTLKTFKIFHNLVLFLLSLYMCLECINQAMLGGYKLFGNALEKGDEPHAAGMAQIVYIFYMSKSYEFVDTVCMLLKKKFNQVSFLHVYHHSTIFFIWWVIAKYAPGGDAYFSVILNSFVHVVMYAYYLFSTLGFSFQKALKPYITTLQMTQFVAMLIQSCYDTLNPCDYPAPIVHLLGGYMITLLILFGNFFIQSYMKAGKKKNNDKKKKDM